MQHSQRLDQRLHMLREEVRAMTQEKEQGERVWRERLQRCQRQLKAKEEEMSRQSQYFENFKSQLQHKLSLARDREQSLQNSIYTLEKRLLDMTVSAATGMATISAVRITAGTITLREEQERLTSMRGEGEGEEERKEERMKKWQPSVSPEREGGREGDEGQTEKEIEGGGNDTKQSSDESRLQGFILSLQEDLRVLLERGEDGMTERRELMEQLSEAQENGHFLGNRVEEMKAEVHRMKLSESSLMEEVEELREDNDRLQLILREAANQTASQSSSVVENACTSPGTNSEGSSAEVQPSLTAVPPDHHQAAAEITQNKPDCGSKPNLSFQSLSLTSETIDEFNLETWSRRGILDLEQIPSEESDALREAYKSLGLGEDLEDLREQRDRLDATLQHTQKELEMVARENTQLKIQLREQAEERPREQGSSREMIGHVQSSPPQDNNIPALAQDDLAQALNQENRALAERIEELMAHIELREVEIKMKQSQLRERASRLEEVRVGLEQENQEQGCLITELTRKTEDDLNTIMELQQKLEESGKQSNTEERVDNIVERVKPQSTSSTQTDDLISVSATGSQHNSHHDLLQNSQQNTLHVDQMCHLTKTVQSLKTEQEELIGKLNSLREQQGEVAQSVQTKTEEKQQLTRTVWGLKEEKDRIFQCLAGLRQEREQLTRTVCGLKDNRDHFIRSMIGLKEEKEQLTKTLCSLEREKEDRHSSGKEEQEQDQIKQSLQSLQTERDQLRRVVLNLKQEKEEITTSLKCLLEQRHQEQSSHTLEDDRDKLIKSLSSLRDEKERVEHSITCLRHEEEQITFVTQSLKEEGQSLQSDSHSQTQTQERNQRQQLVNPNTTDPTEKSETVVGTGDQAAQRCRTNNNRGKSVQEQKDLLRENEDLGSILTRSQEELDKSHTQTKKLQSELCQSEARREEAERRAAEKVMRLTDAANQMEETRRENKSLSAQVKELQSKLTDLLRERTDALLLKTQIEEQYNILTAQLKAKTVALDELNSEYITLKRGQGNKNDLDAALMSVRTRYNDIRAKYDALLKKRSQTDLDMTPLKAKLSCLVVKCQERNNFLAKMMKTMHRHGCADSTLKQQVELLLSDAALRDYTAAFTPRSSVTTGDYSAGFIPRFISPFEDCTTGFIRDQNCLAVLSLTKNGLTPEAGGKCRDFRSDGQVSLSTESSTNIQECRREVAPAATGTPKRSTSSPVQEKPSVEAATALKESSITNTAQLGLQGLQSTQLSLSASGPIQASGGPETFGFHQLDVRGKSSPDLTISTRSSLSPTPPPSFSTRRRMSSPEKIINLHEQLQRTLMSSYQAPVIRGRGQDPRKSLSFSAPADLNLTFQTNRQRLSFNKPHNNSLPVTAAANQTLIPGITVKPAAAAAKSTTLFNAVASRAAHVSFSPNIFTHYHFKANTSATTTSALSGSSNETKSTSHSGSTMTVSPEMTEKVSAVPNILDTSHTTPLTLGTNSFDSNVSICPDTLKSTASDTTAPGKSTTPKCNISNGAAPAARDGPVFTASWTQSGPCSPETPNRSARKSTGPGDQTKLARPRPDAPAEVRSVEVIKTVGQSSLMIGWERPSLDELGCSNGTFVYGYRVFIDGDFHKSVMSSACTKCIAENLDLSLPINISVQTLGSNGLSSNSVHTVFRTDQH